MGYHLREITPQGKYGESTKILEEADEFRESLAQGNVLMALLELSDMIGAIQGWLELNFPGITLADLITMSQATRRAFFDGTRTPK